MFEHRGVGYGEVNGSFAAVAFDMQGVLLPIVAESGEDAIANDAIPIVYGRIADIGRHNGNGFAIVAARAGGCTDNQCVDNVINHHVESVGLGATGIRCDAQDVDASVSDIGVGDGGVRHFALNPLIGAALHRSGTYLGGLGRTGGLGGGSRAMFAQHPDIDIKGIGGAAPLVHVSNQGGAESARCAISVLGIGQSGGGTIAKVPEEAIATPSIDK